MGFRKKGVDIATSSPDTDCHAVKLKPALIPQGKTRRNNEASKTLEPDELKRAAHSFVVSRGRTGKYVSQLVMNMRKVMEPFTASQLRVSTAEASDAFLFS